MGNALVELEHRTFGRQTVVGEPRLLGVHVDRLALNVRTGEVFVASNVERAIYAVDLETMRASLVVGGVGEVTAMAYGELGSWVVRLFILVSIIPLLCIIIPLLLIPLRGYTQL